VSDIASPSVTRKGNQRISPQDGTVNEGWYLNEAFEKRSGIAIIIG
jgi:hypothetical protein